MICAGRVDAEEPRLAREVPRGDGRRRVVRAQVLVDVDVHDVDAVLVGRRRAAAGCRAPARSTATGSAPGVANNTATGLPLPMIVSSDVVCSGHIGIARADGVHAERVRRSSATRRWARPHRRSARRRCAFTWNANGSFSPSRSAMPSQTPSLSKTRSDDVHAAPFSGRPSSCSVVGDELASASSRAGATASVTAPPGREALPWPSIANAKRCGVLDA